MIMEKETLGAISRCRERRSCHPKIKIVQTARTNQYNVT